MYYYKTLFDYPSANNHNSSPAMKHLKPIHFILCIIILINGLYSRQVRESVWSHSRHVKLDKFSSVTTDVPTSFNVETHYETDAPSYEYRFKFDQFPQHDKTIVSTSNRVEYSVTFDSISTPKADNYTVQVDVWFLGVPSHLIGTVISTFQLSDSLNGAVKATQNIRTSDSLINDINSALGIEDNNFWTNRKFYSTAEPVYLDARIYDDSRFCESANMTYKWIVNGLPQEEVDKSIQPTFSKAQLNNITVIVTATKTNGTRLLQKSGSFNITLESKDPITGLTVDGPTEVKLFERLQLDLKIHGGTPPFQYASRFSLDTTKMSMNLWSNGLEGYEYCSKARKYSNDSFHSIIKYFGQRGTRESTISVANDVSVFTKTMNILVY